MRVLVLADLYPTMRSPQGGSFVRDRVEALKAHGVAVDVLALRGAPTPLLREALLRTGRDPSDPAPSSFPDARYRLRLHEYLWSSRTGSPLPRVITRVADSVGRIVQGKSYDVIHAHGMYRASAGVVAREVSEHLGVPYAITLHGSDVNVNIVRNPSAFMPALRDAGAVIYVSEDLRQRAIALGAPSSNAHVVPNGVDVDLFAPRPDAARAPKVSFVGGLAHVKGADRLPEIFRRIHGERPEVEFDVVGAGGLKEDLVRQMSGLPVTFRGHLGRRQVAAVMSTTDVLVVPSRSEGWGCVVLEAQASGARVVATRVGGLVESVGDDRYLVRESDGADGLSERVLWALDQEGVPFRERALGFSWPHIAETEAAIYAGIIARPPST